MNDKYTAAIIFQGDGDVVALRTLCEHHGFAVDGDFTAVRVGMELPPISNAGNLLIAGAKDLGFTVADIGITAPDGIEAPMPKITGTALVIGPAQTILHGGDTPAARALDAIASGRFDVMSATQSGDWTPALCLDRVQTLIDAEVRLGTGGDMEGVARQVAGLCMIALERLEMEKATT